MTKPLLLAFLVLFSFRACLGHKESGSFDLGSYSKIFQFSGFSLLSYSFEISSGSGYISIYLLDEENYQLWSANSDFAYLDDGTELYKTSAKVNNIEISHSSTYWLVVENEDTVTKRIEYSLNLETKGPNTWLLIFLPISIVTVCIAGMVVLYKIYVMRITKVVMDNDKFYYQLEEEEKQTPQDVELNSNT